MNSIETPDLPSLEQLNGQTLCLNKAIVGRTFSKNGRKMSDVQP